MPFSVKDTDRYREDLKAGGVLKPKEREELLKPYLPAPPTSQPARSRESKNRAEISTFGIRRFLREQLYVLSFAFIHIIFSFYIRIRVAYHAVTHRVASVLRYHHRTPDYIRRDVRSLGKMPKHVSVILKLEEEGKRGDAKEKLINDVADITAWCASAGIKVLSVYEKTGILKDTMESEHRQISQKLRDWFGKYQAPDLHLRAPNMPVISPANYHGPKINGDVPAGAYAIRVNLISAEDGRESIIDLTKILTEMSQRGKLSPPDITSDVIDRELKEVLADPDLLISFAPFVDLQGYPPWQIRLTEIYCQEDNQGVGYQVFLNALRKYASASFRMGK